MKLAVTGARGFVGTILVSRAADIGAEVLEIDLPEHDVRDGESLTQLFQRFRPDVVIHLGGISGPMLSNRDPATIVTSNAVGTVNVFNAAARARTNRVISASSVAAVEYIPTTGTSPLSVYGATKIFGENLAAVFDADYATDYVSMRIGSVYGAARRTEHVLTDMISEAVDRHTVTYDLFSWEPLVEVRDVAQLLIGAAATPRLTRTVYDVVRDCVPHQTLAEKIGEISGASVFPSRANSPQVSWFTEFDASPLLADTAAEFEVGLDQGIVDLMTTFPELDERLRARKSGRLE